MLQKKYCGFPGFVTIRNYFDQMICWIVPFLKDFSTSGEQLEHRKIAHD